MEREQFIIEISKMFEQIELQKVSKAQIKTHHSGANGRPGIYFLYNGKKQIIYIGKVGAGNNTSFYARLYGHGSGAHCNKPWFSKCKHYKFKQFLHATNEDLSVIERLMIYGQGQPRYNDIGKINYKLDNIVVRLKKGEEYGKTR